MNFDHVNKVSDYTRNQIMPHLTNRLPVADFGQYLSKMVDSQSCRWMRDELRAYPVNYFVDPVGFAKKYAKKCITFMGTTSPQDGAMNMVYQISPTLHVLARLYHWIEHDKVKAYMMLTCAYRDQEEYLEFFDENKALRLTGNTEERKTGFAEAVHQNDISNLLKGFGQQKQIGEETDNPEEELNR